MHRIFQDEEFGLCDLFWRLEPCLETSRREELKRSALSSGDYSIPGGGGGLAKAKDEGKDQYSVYSIQGQIVGKRRHLQIL
jgi:hypothetical protein